MSEQPLPFLERIRAEDPTLASLLDELKRVRFEKTSESFDQELFVEAYRAWSERWKEMGPEQRRSTLTDIYFDCVPPRYEKHGHVFSEEFVIRPPNISALFAKEAGWDVGYQQIRELYANGRDWRNPDTTVYQYGPSRVVDIMPGHWASVPVTETSVVASSEFSACQAIIGRDGNRVAFAHSLYGCEDMIPQVVDILRGQLKSNAQFDFIYPRIDIGPGDLSHGFSQKGADEHNERYEQIAGRLGMRARTYYFVRAEHNPDDVGGSTILVGQNMLRVIGTRMKRDLGESRFIRQIRTVHDYE